MLRKGVQGQTFNFNYNNRDNEGVSRDLGETIKSICEITPGGVLIFFPSYRLLEKCYEIWELFNVISGIEKMKKVLKEPKDPSKYQSTIDAYYKAIFNNTKKG